MPKVEIYTGDGCYSVPSEDLEKYRVEESQIKEDPDVAGYMRGFNPSMLRPDTRLNFRLGQRPVVRTRGRIVVSAETVVCA